MPPGSRRMSSSYGRRSRGSRRQSQVSPSCGSRKTSKRQPPRRAGTPRSGGGSAAHPATAVRPGHPRRRGSRSPGSTPPPRRTGPRGRRSRCPRGRGSVARGTGRAPSPRRRTRARRAPPAVPRSPSGATAPTRRAPEPPTDRTRRIAPCRAGDPVSPPPWPCATAHDLSPPRCHRSPAGCDSALNRDRTASRCSAANSAVNAGSGKCAFSPLGLGSTHTRAGPSRSGCGPSPPPGR